MTLPADIAALLDRNQPGFRVAASFAADISREGRLTDEWLAAGPAGLALVRGGSVTVLARAELKSLATHRYLSGGRLTARRAGGALLLARYSGARAGAAEEFVRAANRVLREEAESARSMEQAAAPDTAAAAAPGAAAIPIEPG